MGAQSILVTFLLFVSFVSLSAHEYTLEQMNNILSDGYYSVGPEIEVSAYRYLIVIPVDNRSSATTVSRAPPPPSPEPFYSYNLPPAYQHSTSSYSRGLLESPLDRLGPLVGGPSYAASHVPVCAHTGFDAARLPSVDDCRHMNKQQMLGHLQRAARGPIDRYLHQILHQHAYYQCPAFLSIIQEFPEYHDYISQEYRKSLDRGLYGKISNWRIGFTRDFVTRLYRASVVKQNRKAQEEQERAQRQSKEKEAAQKRHQVKAAQQLAEQHEIAQNFENVLPMMQLLLEDEPKSTDEWYNQRTKKRIVAVQTFCDGKQNVYQQKYTLNSDQLALLIRHQELSPKAYESCYGNIVQQTLHQECIDLLNETSLLREDDFLFDYQESLLNCTESARLYNQIGTVDKSMSLTDWCFALFSYGKQIIGAVAQGVIQGVGDLLQDPVQLGLMIAAPEYMAAYQLGRVLYTVVGISLRALTDWQQTRQEVQNWIDPLIDALDQVVNGDIPVTEVVRAGTRLAVGIQAQKLFCSGMKGFCSQLTNNISDQHRQQMQKLVDTLQRRCSYLKNQGCVVFSPEAIEKGVRYIIRCENNIDHIFKAEKHQFNFTMNNNKENIIREVIKDLSGKFNENELFKHIVTIDNHKVCVKGKVINGIPYIGTMYIPWDKK